MKHPHIEQLLLVELIKGINALPSRKSDPGKHHLQLEYIAMIDRVQAINHVKLEFVLCGVLEIPSVHFEVFPLNNLLDLVELRLQHLLHQNPRFLYHVLILD